MNRKNKISQTSVNNQTVDFFEKILQASADGIVIINASHNIIIANEIFCEFFNKKRSEVIETSLFYWLEQFDHDALKKWSDLEKRVYSKGSCRDIEFKLTTENSEIKYISVNASILECTEKEDLGVLISIWRDVTEQKEVESVLKIRQEQHMAIGEISKNALSTQSNIYSFMNQTTKLVAKTLGVEYCKILELLPNNKELFLRAGVGWNEGIVGSSTVRNDINSQAGYTLTSNKPVIAKDLRTETRFFGSKLLRDHGVVSGLTVTIYGKNKFYGVLGVHTTRLHKFTSEDVNFFQSIANILSDVIKRNCLEEELRMFNESLEKRISERTEELFRNNLKLLLEIEVRKSTEEKLNIFTNLINQSNDAIYVIEPETSRFLHFNDKAITNLGYGCEELRHMGIVDIETLMPDLSSWKQCVNELKEKKSLSFEGKHKRNDGTEFPVEVNGKYITHETKDYIIAIARDITERNKMAEALLQAEKLKAMGVMTSGISHEFNNILAIIKGFSLLLKRKYKDHKEISDKIDVILKSVSDGIGIVVRMQDFTRIEADRTEFTSVDVRELVEQVIEFSMPRWKTISEANGIMYYMDKKGMESIPKVSGNSTELREVILNIINNSLDAMTEGGHLSFRTWDKDNNVFLRISDTGEGMYEDIRKNIFDPFLTTKMPKGTGLGMSICYGIIKRHGGEINVESEVGRGTTITIRLPICEDNTDFVTRSEQNHELEVANLRILIVDDEQAVCDFLSEFLSQEGQNVKSVYGGNEAIKLLKSESFDLVLCDLVMPEVGGREVIKMLNTLNKRPKLGLITGWLEEIKTVSKEDLRVDFIVKKPFDFSALSKNINNVFSQS